MDEHQAIGSNPVVSHCEDTLVNRLGILSAGLAFSASGWIAVNSSAGARSAYQYDVHIGYSRHFGSSPVAGAVSAVKELVRVVVADDLLASGIETETATHATGDVREVW